ncbi:MAG: lamin tail domain-containing protein [Actinobacteria bacterium]|nr:lamin tail domain-containing protein [Actinomycetota bacterium]
MPISCRCAAAVAVCACTAVLVPGAGASVAGDLAAVLKDFQGDRDITPCLFTKKQLQNAKSQLTADTNLYAPELKLELNREIRRWENGGCSGASSGGGGIKIVKANGKGGVRMESVTLKNAGSSQVNLGGYSLRDRAGKKLHLGSVKLAKGRTLRVITGCAKGRHKPSRSGSRYYACRTKEFFSDKGDVAELLNKSGTVLARRPTT